MRATYPLMRTIYFVEKGSSELSQAPCSELNKINIQSFYFFSKDTLLTVTLQWNKAEHILDKRNIFKVFNYVTPSFCSVAFISK